MHKILLAAGIAAMATIAQAHDFTAGAIFVDHPMIQEAPPSAPVLGGYVTMHNRGTAPDRLLAIESSGAEKVELHRSVVTDGIARMLPMEAGLEISAGAIVALGDEGTHAMFIKPARRFQAGDEVPATLIFEQAGRVDVIFKVEKRSVAEGLNHESHSQ